MSSRSTSSIHRKVSDALSALRKHLDAEKQSPVLAEEQHHAYTDKYALAEQLTLLAAASWLENLEQLGVNRKALRKLASQALVEKKRVTLNLRSVQRCDFVRKASREVPSDVKVETKSSVFGKSETRVVQTVTEYFWAVSHSYELILFAGKSAEADESCVRFGKRSALAHIITRTEQPPLHESQRTAASAPKPENCECDLTWLFKCLAPAVTGDNGDDAPLSLSVSIDRDDAQCRTPRRNPTVDAALDAMREFSISVAAGLENLHEFAYRFATAVDVSDPSQKPSPQLDPRGLSAFLPVLPLLQPPESPDDGRLETQSEDAGEAVTAPAATATDDGDSNGAGPAASSALVHLEGSPPSYAPLALRGSTLSILLEEERRTCAAALERIRAECADPADEGRLLSAHEASLQFLGAHMRAVLAQYADGVAYIEGMLRAQLVAAVGREISSADFATYLTHHNRKVYRPEYAPQPFCFAVRQPERSPEGVVTIEASRGSSGGDYGGGSGGASSPNEPIRTLRRSMPGPCPPMSFALDAATRVTFHGERHVHAYVDHRFADGRPSPLSLCIKARQFSCFMVLLGRMGGGGTFEPSHAMVVRNKDELKLPLLLETMPSAQEFKDAIASLSPEQQRFATAYRAMQLEGSVFGVLILQLKPQLEKLLRLQAGSLTKEIALTEKLLELFIEYQIPSDLLAFDGPLEAAASEKLAAVRGHVQAIYDTLDEAKKAEVEAEKQKHAFLHPGDAESEEEEEMGLFASAESDAFGCSDAPFASGFGGDLGSRGGARPKMRSAAMGGKGGGKGEERRRGGGASLMRMQAQHAVRSLPPPPPAAAAARCCATFAASQPYQPPQPPPPLPPPPAISGDLHRRAHSIAADPTAPLPADRPPAAAANSNGDGDAADDGNGDGAYELDYTQLPVALDAKLEALDTDAAMRPTKIKIGEEWTKRSQRALLAPPVTSTLHKAEHASEKQKAFDLLDALSRAGSLPIDCASLHVLLAATHCFDDSLIDTLVVKNVNPIEKLERSSLIVAETITGVPAPRLIKPEVYDALAASYAAGPALLPPQEAAEI